ncbi:MAG: UDP-glucose 4-epimerase GalE [Culturomica sp.]|jgi:UDP-glucose 4-epimerase|nr:UDP-glucose 4-epimerase GalE [Culturomica sp.]
MKVFVTGGTGYIGSHTVVELQQNGFEAVIVDNLSNSDIRVLDGIEKITGTRPEFEQFDLTDAGAVRDFFLRRRDIAAVIHFAALKAVGESVNKPLEYYHNNLNSLMNILFSMREFGVNNFVFSSSCTVYGQADVLPVTEQTPRKQAESPYGNTKAVAEDVIRDLANVEKQMKLIALRYFNPIGAHPSAYIGELPNGVPNNLIPFITQTAAGIREQLSVFGDDYNTPDGSAIRDYIDVTDLARAHVIAIRRLIENKNRGNYEYFNIGTGNGVSVLGLINAFEQATGKKVNYKIVGRRPGDIEKIWADTTLANTELGWKAQTPLTETLANAWRWQEKLAAGQPGQL